MTVAVIRFPGSNCEKESIEALDALSIPSELIEWNFNESLIDFPVFYFLAALAIKTESEPVLLLQNSPYSTTKKQSAKQKPILGICNGAQILIESGILSTEGHLNQIIDYNYVEHRPIGFMCDWGFLTPFNSKQNVFLSALSDNDILPIQICHGEGRFIFSKQPTCGLTYTSIDGTKTGTFPTTPNGSHDDIAAISNDAGNVLAIMPHPERSIELSRTPFSIQTYAKKNNLNLVGFSQLFLAFKEANK